MTQSTRNINALTLFEQSNVSDNYPIADVWITYTYRGTTNEARTKIYIELTNIPYLEISSEEYESWLNPHDVYWKFDTRYENFKFDKTTKILTITHINSPKLGTYSVTFRKL